MPEAIKTNHIFFAHDLSPHHLCALPRESSYNFPVFILLVSASVLLLCVYLLYFKKTAQLVKGVFSYGSSKQLQREGYSFFKFFSLSLTAVYVLSASIFFTDLNARMQWIRLQNNDWLLPLCIVFLGALLIVKKLAPVIGSLFLKNQKALNDYFFQYSFSIKTEGLLLLPICLLLHYSATQSVYLIVLGLLFPAAIFSIRIVRTLRWGRVEYGFSIFHIVLYLCTVEIIPLVVFSKVLVAGWLQFG